MRTPISRPPPHGHTHKQPTKKKDQTGFFFFFFFSLINVMQRHFAADQPLRILEIICPFDLSRQRPSPLPLLFDLKLLLDDS